MRHIKHCKSKEKYACFNTIKPIKSVFNTTISSSLETGNHEMHSHRSPCQSGLGDPLKLCWKILLALLCKPLNRLSCTPRRHLPPPLLPPPPASAWGVPQVAAANMPPSPSLSPAALHPHSQPQPPSSQLELLSLPHAKPAWQEAISYYIPEYGQGMQL